MRTKNELAVDKILERTLSEFTEKGFESASMRTIAEKSGYTTGMVYGRFADKSKLFKELVGEAASGTVRRIVNDSSAATETYLAHQLPDMAGAVAMPLGMIVMLFLFDWRFGFICLLPVILGFVCMGKMAGPKMAQDMKDYNNALEDMNNHAVEYVRGVLVVKTFGQTVRSFKKFQGSIDDYYNFCMSYCKKCRPSRVLFTMFINSAVACLIALALILAGGEAIAQNTLLNFILSSRLYSQLRL